MNRAENIAREAEGRITLLRQKLKDELGTGPGTGHYNDYGAATLPEIKRRLLDRIYEMQGRQVEESDALINAMLLRTIIGLYHSLLYIMHHYDSWTEAQKAGFLKDMDDPRKGPKCLDSQSRSLDDLHSLLCNYVHQGYIQYGRMGCGDVEFFMQYALGQIVARFADDHDVRDVIEEISSHKPLGRHTLSEYFGKGGSELAAETAAGNPGRLNYR